MDTRTCPQCQQPLPPEAPQELCPNCLLLAGLSSAYGPAGTRVLGAGPGGAPTPGLAPRPGETFGAYQIIRLLGRGGMGEVFEAEHQITGRRVALKVMSHGLTSEPDRKRFLREGRLAAGVSHPNVVYIFGSEEIDGNPVIAMELVHSGTLRDRVKRQGPLSVPDAVEATLQVIAGLEAAHGTGVLHRDIKPANCFVGADGTIKVGDFGLSISTIARGESLLTTSGSVLGTPAYASPEQLRGEQLDVASDIYSVGATLYDLLTGRPPHDATDFVKLITEVLDKPPAPLESLRPDLPAGLVKVVLRCLAKERDKRFASYAALRNALLPFSATAPSPATLGLRFVAGLMDEAIAAVPTWILLILSGRESFQMFTGERTVSNLLIMLSVLTIDFLYFALPEGLWGAAVGKLACGLRVVGTSRGPAGLLKVALRTLVHRTFWWLPVVITVAFYSAAEIKAQDAADTWHLYDWLWLFILILLFSTMRRRNGFAGLHELVSGTRVVAQMTSHQRPRLTPAVSASASMGDSTAPSTGSGRAPSTGSGQTSAGVPALPTFGLYQVVASLGTAGEGELVLAQDPALRRQVWIFQQRPGVPPVLARRRDLSRGTRLRWLNGHRDATVAWDVYEALDGKPLLQLPPQPWDAVRFWLNDLATEYEAGCRHESLPPVLGLDRIWITADNRAVLLDFPCPQVAADGLAIVPAPSPEGLVAAQSFLNVVAERGLGTLPRPGAAPLPLATQPFFESLRRGRFESTKVLLGNLLSLLGRPAAVSRRRRLATLALAWSPAILLAVVLTATLALSHRRTTREWPAAEYAGSDELRGELRAYEAFKEGHAPVPGNPEDSQEEEEALRKVRRAFRIHIAGHHQELVRNSNFWAHPVVAEGIPTDQRRVAEESVADNPNPSRERLEESDAILKPLRPMILIADQSFPLWLALGISWVLITFVAVLDLGCALFLGEGLFFRLLGVAVVTRAGQRAGRLRLLFRTGLAWSAAVVGMLGVYGVWFRWAYIANSNFTAVAIGVTLVFVGLLAAFLSWILWHPSRVLPDQICGTWLVPR